MNRVTYRVPATSANLGPGFDALGVALCLHNEVTVSRAESVPASNPFLDRAAARFFEEAQCAPVGFAVAIEGDVPRSRGLGSSVTVRLGLLLGLNDLLGAPLDKETLLRLTIELEGHPDNAVPALWGGFCVTDGRAWFRAEVATALRFIAVIPERHLETSVAREVLPKRIDFTEAVDNIQHAALITAAFASGDYERLRGQLRDRLHQPYRFELMPGAGAALDAAEKAGALGAYLSGAGSTLVALTLDNEEAVASAMSRAIEQAGEPAPLIHYLQADNTGAQKVAE